MIRARFARAAFFKTLVQAVNEIERNVRFEFFPAGLGLQTMDASHVTLLQLSVNAALLVEYTCERNASLGVNLPALLKALDNAGTDDELTLLHDTRTETLELRIRGRHNSSTFVLKLMDIDVEMLEIPPMAPDARLELPAREFNKIVRDMSQWGDVVTIGLDKTIASFAAQDGRVRGRVRLLDDEASGTRVATERSVSQEFSLRRLLPIAKAQNVAPSVRLEMLADAPLCVRYDLGAGSYLSYHLSYRQEEADMVAAH